MDPQERGLHRHLVLIEAELQDVSNTVEAMAPGSDLDHCLLEQHQHQQHQELNSGLTSDLMDVSHSIVTLDNDNSDQADKTSTISKVISNSCQHLGQPPFTKQLSSQRLLFPPLKKTSWSDGRFGNRFTP